MSRYDKARSDFEKCIKLARGDKSILLEAKAGLSSLKRRPFEPQKTMVWAGVGLLSTAGLVLLAVTALYFLYYLDFRFKKLPETSFLYRLHFTGKKTPETPKNEANVSTDKKTGVCPCPIVGAIHGKQEDISVDKKTDTPVRGAKQAVFSVWDIPPTDWELDFLLVERTSNVEGTEGGGSGVTGGQGSEKGSTATGGTEHKQGTEATEEKASDQQKLKQPSAEASAKEGPQKQGEAGSTGKGSQQETAPANEGPQEQGGAKPTDKGTKGAAAVKGPEGKTPEGQGPQEQGGAKPTGEVPPEAFKEFLGGATYIGIVIACLFFMAGGALVSRLTNFKVKFLGMGMELMAPPELRKPEVPASETRASSLIR